MDDPAATAYGQPTAPCGSHPNVLQIPDRLLEEPVVRQLLDASPLLFIALTGDGSVVWTSETSRRSLGWSEEFVADAHIVDMVHADDLGAVAATMAEEVRGSWEREHMVVRVRCGDGSYTHVEFGGMDLREPDGTGLYLVWGRSHESTVRLTTFMRAFGAGASLEELAIQVLGWFDASSDDNTATLSLRRGDGSYEAVPWGADVDPALRVDLQASGADKAPWRRAVHTGVLEVETDLSSLDGSLATAAATLGATTLWVLPVHTSSGAAPGALLSIWRRSTGEPLATHGRMLETCSQYLRLAIDWHDSHQALVAAATTDPLTGLANRAHLADAIRADRSPLAAVLFCDLDDFKLVNDRHGHLVGDQLLQEAARRLGAAVRSTDLLARLGGDEFAVFCPDLASEIDAEDVADSIIAALDVPVVVGGQRQRIGCSVGVATVRAGGQGANDLDQLLGEADRALYRAKDLGKGRWARGAGLADPRLPFPDLERREA